MSCLELFGKINKRGIGIRMSWLENFPKINKGGVEGGGGEREGTSIKDQRVYVFVISEELIVFKKTGFSRP